MFLDCDRDSIIYQGEPIGPACHTVSCGEVPLDMRVPAPTSAWMMHTCIAHTGTTRTALCPYQHTHNRQEQTLRCFHSLYQTQCQSQPSAQQGSTETRLCQQHVRPLHSAIIWHPCIVTGICAAEQVECADLPACSVPYAVLCRELGLAISHLLSVQKAECKKLVTMSLPATCQPAVSLL